MPSLHKEDTLKDPRVKIYCAREKTSDKELETGIRQQVSQVRQPTNPKRRLKITQTKPNLFGETRKFSNTVVEAVNFTSKPNQRIEEATFLVELKNIVAFTG